MIVPICAPEVSVAQRHGRICKSYHRFLTSAKICLNGGASNSVTQLFIERAREVAGEEKVVEDMSGCAHHVDPGINRQAHDVQIAKRDLGKSLDRIETVNKPKAA